MTEQRCETCKYSEVDCDDDPCLTCTYDLDTDTMSNYKPLHEHYTLRGGIEPIQFIMSNNFSFLEGCIIKYLYRYRFKGGIDDLLKARQYLNWLIERYNDETEAEVDDDRNPDAQSDVED